MTDDITSADAGDAAPGSARDPHASQVELFLDLVVVAGLALVTSGLRVDAGPGQAALSLLLFCSMWMVWAAAMVQGNVAGDRDPVVVAVMVCLGLMVACVPDIEARSVPFALAYLAVRVLARSILPRNTLVAEWPAITWGGALAPWLVSLLVPLPWRYWLWAAGLTLDIVMLLVIEPDRFVASAQYRFSQRRKRPASGRRQWPAQLDVAHTEGAHLAERLALFALLVLGESVVALIATAAATTWSWRFGVDALLAFSIVTVVWLISLDNGEAGLPAGALQGAGVGRGLVLHLVAAGGLVCFASGLGLLLSSDEANVAGGAAWRVSGGLCAYFAVVAVSSALHPHRWRWQVTAGVLCAIVVLVGLGLLAERMHATGFLLWVAVVAVGSGFTYRALAATLVDEDPASP